MEKLFGLPIGDLAIALAIVCGVVLGAVAALALRNRVFFRLGVRNLGRRRARTALIVVGLMLGTAIISSALSTGDTISSTIRSAAITSLGSADEIVSIRGTQAQSSDTTEGYASAGYFDAQRLGTVERAARQTSLVDGVAPAIIEPVAVLDASSRQTEPQATLFASDPARLGGFGEMRAVPGGTVSLADLGAGEVYVNVEAANDLGTATGDALHLFAGGRSAKVRVKAVVRYDGTGRVGESKIAVLMPLAAAQRFLGHPGQINHVLVSNIGDELSGAAHSDAVVAALDPALAPLQLEAKPVKQDALDYADALGNGFMTFFTTFGTFSIAAGILLVFLIFVMLAAERRTELGIARAVGTRRGHLVQMFLFEGVAYDIVAAAVGALLGVAVAWGMVLVLAKAFGSTGLDFHHDVRVRSLIVAYCLGVLLTFLVVTFSAWRVSVLNIVTAIRNLPAPAVVKKRRRRVAAGVVGLAAGVLLTISGVHAKNATPFLLGVSLGILSLVPIARALGAPERITFTTAGLLIVVWWLLPVSTFADGYSMNFSIWIVGGLVVVVGATWTFIYNADILLRIVTAVLGRWALAAPVARLAAAYPLRNRFRTGTTVAMFTLVVFTLVVGATNTNAFLSAFNNVREYGGGFDVRALTPSFSAGTDLGAAISSAPGLGPAQVKAVASESVVAADARQVGTVKYETYPLRGFDRTFFDQTTFGLAARARGYASDAAVWHALATGQRLAVVDGTIVPRRSNWAFGPPPKFRLHGFYLEDQTFAPVPVQVRDPKTGQTMRVTVIGVLKDSAPPDLLGMLVSQRTAALFGDRATPTIFYLKLAPGVDPTATARALESAFFRNGMQADALGDLLADTVSASLTFDRLLEGFIGLGLVVGVAALGVVSARSVVERRQQIGVLRSIGFQRRMIQGTFLLESSFVALGAIALGTGLGLVIAYNVISDSRKQPSWHNMHFAVPWSSLVTIFAIVYLVALATTLAPARRASRVYPAEALRYE